MKYKIITIGVVGIALAAGGYYFKARPASVELPVDFLFGEVALKEPLREPINEPDKVAVKEPERRPPDGSREYRNERYSFSLFYPEETTVKEFDEGRGALTIVFENVEKAWGFQIFIVPYKESQVSEERFLTDVPSGVRENFSDFYIDGTVAASFYSKNIGLGDTWEVWFIRGGFLYEVTTLKNLDAWLGGIMKSWKFINY